MPWSQMMIGYGVYVLMIGRPNPARLAKAIAFVVPSCGLIFLNRTPLVQEPVSIDVRPSPSCSI